METLRKQREEVQYLHALMQSLRSNSRYVIIRPAVCFRRSNAGERVTQFFRQLFNSAVSEIHIKLPVSETMAANLAPSDPRFAAN